MQYLLFVDRTVDRVGKNFIYKSTEINDQNEGIRSMKYVYALKGYEVIREDNYCRLYYNVENKGLGYILN